ncbi:MAG TPA: 4-hydroxy-3-methylbut-2-enyl diphosphate reductase [Puia sp.]|nr:4-hydroxy-3-methylbut-2-enyl diphosphate reductase [Puia sp.]
MKAFNVPIIYRSPLITAIKNKRKQDDRMKKDFSPTLLDYGELRILLSRHFGFCFGVENAIEIAFRTIEDNPGRRIFLLSEMIHNPQVNADLESRGVSFIQDTYGKQLIPFSELHANDIVIIPAFGTTLEIEKKLLAIGVQTERYNTTCPFVEKVWNRSEQIASKSYSVIIHGKPGHEETRATFSHAANHAPAVVVKDIHEAKALAKYIGNPSEDFYKEFLGRYSDEFNIYRDLERIGVVNQTTMLASETQAIADMLRQAITDRYGTTKDNEDFHFADTRDTLCYATNDNQSAVIEMLRETADLALVVGGYNSSNTSHLVELCEEKLPTFFISSEEKILASNKILHYNIHRKEEVFSMNYLPVRKPTTILLTSGASCPDALVEGAIKKLAGYFDAGEPAISCINRKAL